MTQGSVYATPQYVAIHRWAQACSDVPQARIRWADTSAPWPSIADGPWISLRVVGESEANPYTVSRRRVFAFADVSVTSISGDELVCAHPLSTGDGPIRVTGIAVDYWAIRVSGASLKLAASFALAMTGTAISLSAFALPMSVTSTDKTVKAGAEVNLVTSAPSTRELSIQVLGDGAMEIARTIATRARAPQISSILGAANVGLLGVGGIQNLSAAIDAATFVPRATMTARLSVSQEHVDVIGMIETITTMGTTS